MLPGATVFQEHSPVERRRTFGPQVSPVLQASDTGSLNACRPVLSRAGRNVEMPFRKRFDAVTWGPQSGRRRRTVDEGPSQPQLRVLFDETS